MLSTFQNTSETPSIIDNAITTNINKEVDPELLGKNPVRKSNSARRRENKKLKKQSVSELEEGEFLERSFKQKREIEEGQIVNNRKRVRSTPHKHTSAKYLTLNSQRKFWRNCWKWKQVMKTLKAIKLFKFLKQVAIKQRYRRTIRLRDELYAYSSKPIVSATTKQKKICTSKENFKKKEKANCFATN